MILQVHNPNWAAVAPQSAGLGCSCGGQCEPCKMGMRGFGDFPDLSQFTTSDWANQIGGFLTQQVGPLPMWAWAGIAFAGVWVLFFPHGSEYRRKKQQLDYDYSGYGRIRKRAGKLRRGTKEAFS